MTRLIVCTPGYPTVDDVPPAMSPAREHNRRVHAETAWPRRRTTGNRSGQCTRAVNRGPPYGVTRAGSYRARRGSGGCRSCSVRERESSSCRPAAAVRRTFNGNGPAGGSPAPASPARARRRAPETVPRAPPSASSVSNLRYTLTTIHIIRHKSVILGNTDSRYGPDRGLCPRVGAAAVRPAAGPRRSPRAPAAPPRLRTIVDVSPDLVHKNPKIPETRKSNPGT